MPLVLTGAELTDVCCHSEGRFAFFFFVRLPKTFCKLVHIQTLLKNFYTSNMLGRGQWSLFFYTFEDFPSEKIKAFSKIKIRKMCFSFQALLCIF